jgi:hypothetical protein
MFGCGEYDVCKFCKFQKFCKFWFRPFSIFKTVILKWSFYGEENKRLGIPNVYVEKDNIISVAKCLKRND